MADRNGSMKHIYDPCKTTLSKLAVEMDKQDGDLSYSNIKHLFKAGIIDANETIFLMQRVYYALQ